MVLSSDKDVLRAIGTATDDAIEIPTRDDVGPIRVCGTAGQGSRGSLTAVSTDIAHSHLSPLESPAAEQTWCGIVNRAGFAQLWMSLATNVLRVSLQS